MRSYDELRATCKKKTAVLHLSAEYNLNGNTETEKGFQVGLFLLASMDFKVNSG